MLPQRLRRTSSTAAIESCTYLILASDFTEHTNILKNMVADVVPQVKERKAKRKVKRKVSELDPIAAKVGFTHLPESKLSIAESTI
jgi:hypothetical protein